MEEIRVARLTYTIQYYNGAYELWTNAGDATHGSVLRGRWPSLDAILDKLKLVEETFKEKHGITS